jgi:hypothetical protein
MGSPSYSSKIGRIWRKSRSACREREMAGNRHRLGGVAAALVEIPVVLFVSEGPGLSGAGRSPAPYATASRDCARRRAR